MEEGQVIINIVLAVGQLSCHSVSKNVQPQGWNVTPEESGFVFIPFKNLQYIIIEYTYTWRYTHYTTTEAIPLGAEYNCLPMGHNMGITNKITDRLS